MLMQLMPFICKIFFDEDKHGTQSSTETEKIYTIYSLLLSSDKTNFLVLIYIQVQ